MSGLSRVQVVFLFFIEFRVIGSVLDFVNFCWVSVAFFRLISVGFLFL